MSIKFEFDEYTSEYDKQRHQRSIVAKDGSFHLYMNTESGITMKYGHTHADDPPYLPWGPEIADVEITTACNGIRGVDGTRAVCPGCYKSLVPTGLYMSIDCFRRVFAQLNRACTLTQIAFGVDAQCNTNPDVWKIMDHCIEHNVTPNVTVADIDEATAENIVSRCGACAVSAYQRNPEVCYDSIWLLIKAAKKLNKPFFKVNMHLLIAQETFEFCKEVLAHVKDKKNDKRIADLNAVVMLGLKTKGRGEGWHVLTQEQFNELVDYAMDNGIRIGMDSCSVNKFVKWMGDDEAKKRFYTPMIESCESTLYSIYVNVKGRVFPCSFLEGVDGAIGINLDTDEPVDFWNNAATEKFRCGAVSRLKRNGFNSCPYYKV